MTKEILVVACVLLSWLWSLLEIICNLNFYYCFYILPYIAFAIILNNLNSKKRKNSDICLQTEFERIEMKNASTLTDDCYACGDVTKAEVRTSDLISNSFERKHFSNTNPFIDELEFGDSCNNFPASGNYMLPILVPVSLNKNNPFLEVTKTIQNSIHWFSELPEMDNAFFEVEEQELIDIFEKPCLINNPFAEAYLSNPFVLHENLCEMPSKINNPFEKLPKGDTNPFSSLMEESRDHKLDSAEWQQHDKFFQKILSSKLH